LKIVSSRELSIFGDFIDDDVELVEDDGMRVGEVEWIERNIKLIKEVKNS
jgi:hypothetical protein